MTEDNKVDGMDRGKGVGRSSDQHRSKKKFRWTNPLWIEFLLKFLADQARNGQKSDNGFKSTAITAAMRALSAQFGINVQEVPVHNQLRALRKQWTQICTIKSFSGATWDEHRRMIVMAEETYATYVLAHPKHAQWINKPIPFYDELEIVCSKAQASKSQDTSIPSGNRIDVPCSESMPDAPVESMPDAPADVEANSSHTRGPVMRSSPGAQSSGRSASRKSRSKRSRGTDDEEDHIASIAQSLSEMATAFKTSLQERNPFKDLYGELSSVGGFTEDELDTIYDHLAKDLTLTQSFMAKPQASKARFMRQYLVTSRD